jgi:hypothetical protein
MSDMHSMKKQEENYTFLLQLPIVKDLLKENKSLKKEFKSKSKNNYKASNKLRSL